MSGLLRGCCRWPSWVCARVSGTKPQGVLEAQSVFRYRLSCLDHSLPITLVSRSCRISRARARRLRQGGEVSGPSLRSVVNGLE